MTSIGRAELLAVGTELLLGEIVDTNSSWLARSLADLGVDVYWSQRVGDNLDRLKAAIDQALERSDLLVLTGGLGPTGDDLTREAIAATLGETPQIDPGLEAVLREHFMRRGREMPLSNLKQAWLIPSAEALPNPLGTAPGWLARTSVAGSEKHVVALPGPPRELQRMWQEEAVPRLPIAGAALHRLTLKTYGLGESTIAELLAELAHSANPTVATYAKADGVHVRIAAKAADLEQARDLVAAVGVEARGRLAEAIWGEDDDELAALVVAALERRGSTLALLESSSGGRLTDLLSAVPGAEDVYRGSVVALNPQTMAALGLPGPAELGGDSSEFAVRLAEAVRDAFSAFIGVAVTSGGTPDAGRQGQATDEAVVAVHSGGETAVKQLDMTPVPAAWRRERISNAALHLLWSQLR